MMLAKIIFQHFLDWRYQSVNVSRAQRKQYIGFPVFQDVDNFFLAA